MALVFIGVDWLAGTSLMRGPDWVLPAKLTALAATLLWALLIFAPAATLSWALDAPSASAIRPPLSLLKRVRPIVGALALYGMLFGGALVWSNMPPYEPWLGEFVMPGPDVRGARLAILGLEIKALDCMRDPSPAHCSRPDIQRIQARYYLKWLDEVPGIFEGRRSWG